MVSCIKNFWIYLVHNHSSKFLFSLWYNLCLSLSKQMKESNMNQFMYNKNDKQRRYYSKDFPRFIFIHIFKISHSLYLPWYKANRSRHENTKNDCDRQLTIPFMDCSFFLILFINNKTTSFYNRYCIIAFLFLRD